MTSDKKIGQSVVICTHNPRKEYLTRTLDALKAQTLPKDKWELLLIDNASQEPMNAKWDLSWHPNASHFREEELGLTPARLRGIKESRGDVLVFVDDDNILEPNYLKCSYEIQCEYSLLGAWGGASIPEFEVAPNPELASFLPCLALRDVPSQKWSNYDLETVPIGAGMCIRSKVAHKYLADLKNDSLRQFLDRRGDSLMGGGDIDLCLTSFAMGLGTGLFPGLRLSHLIPRARLQREYLYKICKLSVICGHIVRFIHFGDVPRRPNLSRRIYQLSRQMLGLDDRLYDKVKRQALDEAIVIIENIQKREDSVCSRSFNILPPASR